MNTTEIAVVAQETEVPSKPSRRHFGAEYKRRILREADACTKPVEIGALLRREWLYSSHLVAWRLARDRSALAWFPRGAPRPSALPTEVWINKPTTPMPTEAAAQ